MTDGATVTAFRAVRAFNDPSIRHLAGLRSRADHRLARAVGTTSIVGKIIGALCEDRTLPVKEILEAFEFVERARRKIRAPAIADLCCGHGLAGLLFAALERKVDDVVLLDAAKHDNQAATLEAVLRVAPWVEPKVRWIHGRVQHAGEHIAPGTAVIAIHACGARTDHAIRAALGRDGPIAVMPCCHAGSTNQAPKVLQSQLGTRLSCDVHRTYLLEAQGYQVGWQEIPVEVTPMNRIIWGRPVPQASGP